MVNSSPTAETFGQGAFIVFIICSPMRFILSGKSGAISVVFCLDCTVFSVLSIMGICLAGAANGVLLLKVLF